MMRKKKYALVTGGNRGIGLEICRQLARLDIQTLLTARNTSEGERIALHLQKEGLPILFHALDVTSEESIRQIVLFVEQQWGGLDILINNAGIFVDKEKKALNVEADQMRVTLETNLIGPLRLSQQLIPLMRKFGGGRIVNVSSTLGQMAKVAGGFPAYRVSKASLNVITLMLAHELRGTNILVNSFCPGWVNTDMGGPQADRSAEQGAETAIWLATLPDDGPTGGFFHDRKPIPW
jgi:NAD(P)-dependent dehydrogenase (short-subunit alcohol dehydrogenase family)